MDPVSVDDFDSYLSPYVGDEAILALLLGTIALTFLCSNNLDIFTCREAARSCRSVGKKIIIKKLLLPFLPLKLLFFGDFKCFQPVTTNFINLH